LAARGAPGWALAGAGDSGASLELGVSGLAWPGATKAPLFSITSKLGPSRRLIVILTVDRGVPMSFRLAYSRVVVLSSTCGFLLVMQTMMSPTMILRETSAGPPGAMPATTKLPLRSFSTLRPTPQLTAGAAMAAAGPLLLVRPLPGRAAPGLRPPSWAQGLLVPATSHSQSRRLFWQLAFALPPPGPPLTEIRGSGRPSPP